MSETMDGALRGPRPFLVWKSYRFVRRIGAGGFGEVWEAENTRVAALKSAIKVIMRDKLDADPVRHPPPEHPGHHRLRPRR
jgi:serine/threonine protein kinase